jgi:hypothetical protein
MSGTKSLNNGHRIAWFPAESWCGQGKIVGMGISQSDRSPSTPLCCNTSFSAKFRSKSRQTAMFRVCFAQGFEHHNMYPETLCQCQIIYKMQCQLLAGM